MSATTYSATATTKMIPRRAGQPIGLLVRGARMGGEVSVFGGSSHALVLTPGVQEPEADSGEDGAGDQDGEAHGLKGRA